LASTSKAQHPDCADRYFPIVGLFNLMRRIYGILMCLLGASLIVLPILRYRKIAPRLVEVGQFPTIQEAMWAHLPIMIVFSLIGGVLIISGVWLMQGRSARTKKLIGMSLLPPGIIAIVYGSLQLADPISGVWSGAYKSTGYGLFGYILLHFSFFAVPLLILGSTLIYGGIKLMKNPAQPGAARVHEIW